MKGDFSMENPIINAKPHKVIDSTVKALPQTVKTIDTALSGVIKILGYPTSFLGEYANYSLQKVKNELSIKLNGKDNIVQPPIYLAAPLLQKCQFTADSKHLHSLFANLLATAMTEDMQELAHPAFIEIISQLSPEEAKILFDFPDSLPMCAIRVQKNNRIQHVSNSRFRLTHPLGDQFSLSKKGVDYITHIILYKGIEVYTEHDLRKIGSITDNFARLGLISLHEESYLVEPDYYSHILAVVKPFLQTITCPPENEAVILPQMATITDFGKQFLKACVL